ncbi:sigma factor [Salinilacustrithrix flava]|uniref:sigma factor n=1 Tax=Salinilacustrithrix flava TaxID=2957203 RepID=UPI003D7C1677
MALVGLWQASMRYEPSAGAAFSTYAVTMIEGRVMHELRKYRCERPCDGRPQVGWAARLPGLRPGDRPRLRVARRRPGVQGRGRADVPCCCRCRHCRRGRARRSQAQRRELPEDC